MTILFEHQILAADIQRCVELRKFLHSSCYCLEQECQWRDFDVLFGIFRTEFFTEGFHFGNVSLIELCDMRNGHPVAMQICTGDFLDT